MRVVQILDKDNRKTVVAKVEEDRLQLLKNRYSLYELCMEVLLEKSVLSEFINENLSGEEEIYEEVIKSGRLLSPMSHPDPHHLFVTGTGLTHLGSAEARDKMHRELQSAAELTDSKKMFKMGLEGGKPEHGKLGVQPEWFYKGNGYSVVHPYQALRSPSFALDGGEEAEICGIYIVDHEGQPWRIGHALGNEFSDHKMEKINYLYLAHSKLRNSAFGPEILLGDCPKDIRGLVRLKREEKTYWEKEFLTGEANMSYYTEGLEFHHFKYPFFRHPGDVHVHYFGTGTASFADMIEIQDGDTIEIAAPVFGKPLINLLLVEAESKIQEIRNL